MNIRLIVLDLKIYVEIIRKKFSREIKIGG